MPDSDNPSELTPMEVFRDLARKLGFDPSVGPSDEHVRQPDICPRCELDMALWGEAVYDLKTGKHLAVEHLVRMRRG